MNTTILILLAQATICLLLLSVLAVVRLLNHALGVWAIRTAKSPAERKAQTEVAGKAVFIRERVGSEEDGSLTFDIEFRFATVDGYEDVHTYRFGVVGDFNRIDPTCIAIHSRGSEQDLA